MEAMELSIRDSMRQVGGVLMEKLLNADGGDYRGMRVPCGAGHEAVFMGYRNKQITTVLSEMEVKRAYYHCASCGRGVIPKDRDLDLCNTSFSPGLRRMMARVGAKESFEDGRQDLEVLAGVRVTTKEVERVTEAIGSQVEASAHRECDLILNGQVLPFAPPVPILYIVIDGTGVPMVPSETVGRCGKQTERAKTRESKLGAVFTQTRVNADRYPIRDEVSTTYVGVIETAEAFGRRIYAEAVRRGLNRAKKVVVLGDGAAWIRGIAEEHFPNAISIVDLFHALEYLWNVGKLVYGTTGPAVTRWFENQRKELKEGNVKKNIAAIKRLKSHNPSVREAIEKTLNYFVTNQDRMQYAEWIKQGLFVGSGVIEAGCKRIVGQRLKQSGMRWTVRGANAIIALRCCQMSGRWEEFWENRATG
jgi:uncharacterized OB-fold protein